MNKGWIKLHRKILDCWFWDEKPYDRARAWVDLLLLANHDDKKISFDGKPITIKRGQYLTSILKLSDRWGWSRNKTKRFLDALECDGMITTDRTNKRTLVNVVNYGIYQDSETTDEPTDEPTDGQQKDNGRTTDEPQTRMNKNDKNEKNIYIADFFEQCWSIYPNKKGKGKISDAKKKKLYKEVGLDQMVRCIERYKSYCVDKDIQFVMYGSTFFNSGYVDYLDENYNDGNIAQQEETRGDDGWQG